MKYRSVALYLAAAGLLALVPLTQTRAQGGGDKKTPEQMEIESLRQKVDAQALELAESKKTLEAVVAYLNAQSDAAKAMESTLADAEKKGFAVGENWGSRVVLLEGWREQLAQLQQDVPTIAAPKPAVPAEQPKPARRN